MSIEQLVAEILANGHLPRPALRRKSLTVEGVTLSPIRWQAAARAAARAAAWHAVWAAAGAAVWAAASGAFLALLTRDLISSEHFEALYGRWREVIGDE